MSIRSLVTTACLLSCMTSAAWAQTSVDRSFKVTSKNCDGVQWSAESLARYPTIGAACQSVEERNGKTYVKFQGTVKRNDRGKQLVVDFKDAGDMTLTPPAETHLYVQGKRTPVSDLRRGDELNFYIAEDRLAAQFPESDAETAQFVAVPIATQEAPEEESEQMAAALPETASPAPLLALCGLTALGFGALLTLYRRR